MYVENLVETLYLKPKKPIDDLTKLFAVKKNKKFYKKEILL